MQREDINVYERSINIVAVADTCTADVVTKKIYAENFCRFSFTKDGNAYKKNAASIATQKCILNFMPFNIYEYKLDENINRLDSLEFVFFLFSFSVALLCRRNGNRK